MQRCEAISQEKFTQDSWILGYSPRYLHRRVLEWSQGIFQLEMRVHQDAIEELKLLDNHGVLAFETACQNVVGKPLRLLTLVEAFKGVSLEELLELF